MNSIVDEPRPSAHFARDAPREDERAARSGGDRHAEPPARRGPHVLPERRIESSHLRVHPGPLGIRERMRVLPVHLCRVSAVVAVVPDERPRDPPPRPPPTGSAGGTSPRTRTLGRDRSPSRARTEVRAPPARPPPRSSPPRARPPRALGARRRNVAGALASAYPGGQEAASIGGDGAREALTATRQGSASTASHPRPATARRRRPRGGERKRPGRRPWPERNPPRVPRPRRPCRRAPGPC